MHEALARRKFDGDLAPLSGIFTRNSRILVNSMEFPFLDVTFEHSSPLRLRMRADQWNELPPSVELLDAAGNPNATPMPGGIFNPSAHPNTGMPFVCMRGTLEYHTHPSHTQEVWDQYKGTDGMDLLGIALQIGNAWRRTVS